MAVRLTIRSANGFVRLAPYLDVEAGRGLEPGAPSFTNKVFAHSLLKQGATLALEDLQLKEQVFPLKLTAASKDALSKLVEEINLVINTPGAQVEWLDEGASRPTYLDLASGQFDDEFDYRLGQNNWLKGRLRLFSQPLGYWSREGARQVKVSGVATSTQVGTAPVVVFPASGAFEGDAPALIQAGLNGRGWLTGNSYMALSVLPTSEYTPWVAIPSMIWGGAPTAPIFSAATNAPGGTAARWNHPVIASYLAFSATAAKYSYTGENRLLLAARTPPGAKPALVESYGIGGAGGVSPITSQTITATSTWALYDLGVARGASAQFAHGSYYEWLIAIGSPEASSGIEVAGVVQLPESSTTWLNTQTVVVAAASSQWGFDGVGNSVYFGADIGVPASGIAATSPLSSVLDWTGLARGAFPQVAAAATPASIAMLGMNAYGASNNGKLEMALNVLERFRYAA